MKEYIKYQHQHGHEGLVVIQSGFLVSQHVNVLSRTILFIGQQEYTSYSVLGYLSAHFSNILSTEVSGEYRFIN